jgi:hypothetical protein
MLREISLGRFMWWAPWRVTQPLRFSLSRGTDEWNNSSILIKLPLLGCFIFFYGQFDRNRLMSFVTEWVADPQGGGARPELAERIRAHNPQCETMVESYLWLPRPGTVHEHSPYPHQACPGCGVEFYADGLIDGRCSCCAEAARLV